MTEPAKIPTVCPLCLGVLQVDEEYMQRHYGPAYVHMPWQQWTFYCEGPCEEAGPWTQFSSRLPETTPAQPNFDQLFAQANVENALVEGVRNALYTYLQLQDQAVMNRRPFALIQAGIAQGFQAFCEAHKDEILDLVQENMARTVRR